MARPEVGSISGLNLEKCLFLVVVTDLHRGRADRGIVSTEAAQRALSQVTGEKSSGDLA